MEIVIVGTGPAALFAGYAALKRGKQVAFFEQKKAPGRKFLVAGDGGFNLSHSEDIASFIQKYNRSQIAQSVRAFTNEDARDLFREIGIETYVGSSGKIFPLPTTKPIAVISALVTAIKSLGGTFHFEHRLSDFDSEKITFENNTQQLIIPYSKAVFALGGASWSKTGSDGKWLALFNEKNIPTLPFQSSNSGFEVEEKHLLEGQAGATLKNCVCKLGNKEKLGDLNLTSYGLEGTPIYYVNSEFRDRGIRHLVLDLKPQFSKEKIVQILQSQKNIQAGLKALKLNPTAIHLLRTALDKESYTDTDRLSSAIKSFGWTLTGLRPIEEVISSVGGVAFSALDEDYALISYPNIHCIGEMLDWDAPTGGYLLQACFSQGMQVGRKL